MVKKINMSAVKEFMFNHGEKVALGTCAFLALLFGSFGLWRAFSTGRADSGKPWVKEFEDQRKRIADDIRNAQPAEYSDKQLEPENYVWGVMDSNFAPSPYIFFLGDPDHKRNNPQALAIKDIQLDYVRGLAYMHDINQDNKLRTYAGAGTGGTEGFAPAVLGQKAGSQDNSHLPPVLKAGQHVRMVVVTAVFPMKQQVEEFQRAFKMASQKEMFDLREDLPRVLGIDVVKYELFNGQKVNKDGEALLFWDGKKVVKGPALDKLLRNAIYDEKTPKAMERYIHAGLTTPMPWLANAHYPKFDFPGFEIAWDEVIDAKPEIARGGINMPPEKIPGTGVKLPGKGPKDKVMAMPGNEAATPALGEKKLGTPLKSADVKKADPALYNRLFEKDHDYNIYHVLGLYPSGKVVEEKKTFGVGNTAKNSAGRYFAPWDIEPPGAGGAVGPKAIQDGAAIQQPMNPMGVQPMNPMGGVRPGDGQGGAFANWDRDALVRFIDPDVVPGRSYQYVIQVRLANPNYGKKDLVAFNDLALVSEITSAPAWTKTIDIPHDYFLYAVDQHLLDEWAAEKQVKKLPPRLDPFLIARDQTTFQVHQWTEIVPDSINRDPLVIGDWAVAERVAVRRGEPIGFQAFVQVPYWEKNKDIFEVPMIKDPMVKETKKTTMKPGLKMDFKKELERPILVDFVGGKRYKGAAGNLVEEETAVDALVLAPDGRLVVLNSRADADAAQEIDPRDPTIQTSRQDRVLGARRRVDEVLHRGDSANPKSDTKLPGPPKK